MSTVDYHRVLKRVDDVIQINVMSADEGDFLAAHMPFEHLEVTDSGLGQAQARAMSEEQVYEELVKKANDRHRFIIVPSDQMDEGQDGQRPEKRRTGKRKDCLYPAY